MSKRRATWLNWSAAPARLALNIRDSTETPWRRAALSNRVMASVAALSLSRRCISMYSGYDYRRQFDYPWAVRSNYSLPSYAATSPKLVRPEAAPMPPELSVDPSKAAMP
jgi:hypothetical protein